MLDGINWKAALDSVQGDRRLLAEVIEAFLEEYPRLVEQLAAAAAAGDAKGVQRVGHTIKGSMRCLGADDAASAAAELEALGRLGLPGDGREQIEAVAREVATVLPSLREFTRNELVRSQ